MVTRFECRSLARLVLLIALHVRLKHHVRRRARGLIGSKALVDWRRRTLLSISLWEDLDSVYSMGGVPQHVMAARLPHRLNVATTCGVYCFAGDWRQVMFRTPCDAHSPLWPADGADAAGPREPEQGERR